MAHADRVLICFHEAVTQVGNVVVVVMLSR
jgi:hypothetical protein